MKSGRKGRTFGENSLRHSCKCEWCGIEFLAKRPDAKTCKPAHRVAFARWVKKWEAKWGRKPNHGPRGYKLRQYDVSKAVPNEVVERQLYRTLYL